MEKLFNIIKPLMDNGTLDSENSAVQESLALLFKSEAGVEYQNTPPDMTGLGEEFDIPNTEQYDVSNPESGQTEIINLFEENG